MSSAADFATAKVHLQMQPALVITDLKLGPYNGLHLAIRAEAQGVPALIIGERGQGFEHDAEQFGAAYLATDDVGRERILMYVESLLSAARPAEPQPSLGWIDSPHNQSVETPAKVVGSEAHRPGSDPRLMH